MTMQYEYAGHTHPGQFNDRPPIQAKDCCEVRKEVRSVQAAIYRIGKAISDLGCQLSELFPRLASVQRSVPTCDSPIRDEKRPQQTCEMADWLTGYAEQIEAMSVRVSQNRGILEI